MDPLRDTSGLPDSATYALFFFLLSPLMHRIFLFFLFPLNKTYEEYPYYITAISTHIEKRNNIPLIRNLKKSLHQVINEILSIAFVRFLFFHIAAQ